ncbi:MAG: rhodanese-like domain-containing protein [bacterium]
MGKSGTNYATARWFTVVREAVILLAAALVLAGGSWLLRAEPLPLAADASLYEIELAAPLISLEQAFSRYDSGSHLFVDTREPALITQVRIGGSFAIRASTFADDLIEAADFIWREDALVLYGNGDLRDVSSVAARFLERGYENIEIMAGGIEAWRQNGYPVSSDDVGGDE